MVTGGTKLTSINKLYDETGWEKLADQRTNHKLVLFHKISLQCNLYARATNRYLRSKFLDVYGSNLLGYRDYSSLAQSSVCYYL
jgi:hypothetical protein